MKAFLVNLQTEPVIIFHDPKKAQAFFIDDDTEGSWRRYFWSYDDLDELADNLAKLFFYEKDTLGDPFIEGFGQAKYVKNNVWAIEDSHFGKITVSMEDLDNHYSATDVTKKLDSSLAYLLK